MGSKHSQKGRYKSRNFHWSRNIALTSVALFGLNVMVNNHINKKIDSDITAHIDQFKEVSSHKYVPGADSLIDAAQELCEKKNIFQPFWSNYAILTEGEKLVGSLEEVIKKKVIQIIDLGIASDILRQYDTRKIVSDANEILQKYDLLVDTVVEKIEIDFPPSFDLNDASKGVSNSFKRKHDFYIALTGQNFSAGEKDYGILTDPDSHFAIIDKDCPKKFLGRIVAHELVNMLLDRRTYASYAAVTYDHDPEADKPLIVHKTKNKDYDTSMNLDKERSVTVDVLLDGVSEADARYLISNVSKQYMAHFKISFKPLEFMEYTLPKKWDNEAVMSKFKNTVKKKSDIYLLLISNKLLLASNDLIDGGSKREDFSLDGVAAPFLGYCLARIDVENKLDVLMHELGHLFQAEHVYLKNGIMHPYSDIGHGRWDKYNCETILKNKYHTWEFSNK